MAHSNRQLQDQFVEWLRLSPGQRGEVTSEAEWARRHGVTDRTLRRWKASPGFEERLGAAAPAPPVTRAAPAVEVEEGEVPAGDEADYRVVKTALVEGAKAGNPKYLELYFRTYGKPFVEEEVASRATDLAGVDMDELVARTLAAVAPEAIARHLESLGWRVQEGANGDSDSRV